MARGRTSLRERGQQLLGLKRRERGDRALLNAWGRIGLRLPNSAENTPRAGPGPVSHASFKGKDADVERRIESMLDAEAAAAIGEDVPLIADGSDGPSGSGKPLPAVEWISPVSPTMPRPAPAPPPFVRRTQQLGEASTQIAAPGPEREEIAVSEGERPIVPPQSSDRGCSPSHARVMSNTTRADEDLHSAAVDGGAERDLLERADIEKQFALLDDSIRMQYERILAGGVSRSKAITDWCHSLLAEARTIVICRRPSDLARAEWDVEQVRARLARAETSDREWYWPVLVTLWGVVWLLGLLYVIMYPTPVLKGLPGHALVTMSVSQYFFLQALFFGAIGSVAAVFCNVLKHVRERSFAREYVLGYFGKPFLGMILGSLVYLVFFFLVTVVELVSEVDVQGQLPGTVTNALYAAPMLFSALVAGFKESQILDALHGWLVSGLSKQRRLP